MGTLVRARVSLCGGSLLWRTVCDLHPGLSRLLLVDQHRRGSTSLEFC